VEAVRRTLPLRDAIDVAREQRTTSWELRAATTLAGMLEEQGDAATAAAILAPIHDSFEDGPARGFIALLWRV